MDAPNYSTYSINELEDALAHIDHDEYPERVSVILEEIALRQTLSNHRGISSNQTQTLGFQQEHEAGYQSKLQKAQQAASSYNEVPHPNWLIRFWKGQVSLPISYWVVGILISLGTLALSAFVEIKIDNASSRIELGIYMMLLYLVLVPVITWQSVGIIRSAIRHPHRGGSQGWSIVAIVMVAIGIIRFSIDFYQSGVPIITESISLIGADSTYPATQFRVLNDGTELELYGGIEIGSELLLLEALQQNENVSTIHLHSIGGRLIGALRLADIVKEYNLNTYVKTSCASACTIVYLAGKERLLGEDGVLQFHAPALGGKSLHDNTDLNGAFDGAYKDAGVPNWFAKKIRNTPNTELWAPSHKELLRAGIVSRIVDSSAYGFSGFGDENEINTQAVESGLLTHAYLVAMKDKDPDTYYRIVTINEEGLREGASINTIATEAQAVLEQRVTYYIAHGSDADIVDYWQVIIKQMQELQGQHPLACAAFVYPEEVPLEHHAGNEVQLSSEVRALELEALARLIANQQVSPSLYSDEESDDMITTLVTDMQDNSKAHFEVVVVPENFVDSPDIMCSAAIEIQQRFIDYEVQTAAKLLRTINAL
ncbi:hypothetical protein Q4561_17675 [Alteromonas sp. 1_MG-2023]|uniref:hypothetical protein n=1 Tax=Alteromonas sp. 1_MG-2023 TaxID=3062669 RepID=UPI0026E1F507|nr:hypothetical protein [Alteromonas sp. 1_MG-2023]MDO6568907.1 hypothetical protein [Alteromonas sp. 1_MG-2023]